MAGAGKSDLPEWAWLVPILSKVSIQSDHPEGDEMEAWLSAYYPEMGARSEEEVAHMDPGPPTNRVRWAKLKSAAIARWRYYLISTPRRFRGADLSESVSALEREVEQRSLDFSEDQDAARAAALAASRMRIITHCRGEA